MDSFDEIQILKEFIFKESTLRDNLDFLNTAEEILRSNLGAFKTQGSQLSADGWSGLSFTLDKAQADVEKIHRSWETIMNTLQHKHKNIKHAYWKQTNAGSKVTITIISTGEAKPLIKNPKEVRTMAKF
jgi:Ni,Fe-hydrogenase I large subunit